MTASTDLPASAGIYRITCTANGKVYIGSSLNVRRRIGQHRTELKGGRHRCSDLQAAWGEHIAEMFECEVIELVSDIDSLRAREAEEFVSARSGGIELFNAHNPPVLDRSLRRRVECREKIITDRRAGLPSLTPRQVALFHSKYVKTDGCWEWHGRLSGGGYGRFAPTPDVRWQAHRLAWTLANGPIAPGLYIHHRCKNRRCVNPAHLAPVTPFENALVESDSITAKNKDKTHCQNGHPFDLEHARNYKGHRVCRECNRIWQREKYARERQNKIASGEFVPKSGPNTVCPCGRLYDRSYNLKSGKSKLGCSYCRRLAGRKAYAKKAGKPFTRTLA